MNTRPTHAIGAPKRPLLAFLLALAVTTGAQAQTGAIRGTVTTPGGDGLAGATVLIVELQREASTNADGSYSLKAPPGQYLVLATALGHESGNLQAFEPAMAPSGWRRAARYARAVALAHAAGREVRLGRRLLFLIGASLRRP